MMNEQTQVHGSTISNYCKMQAAYLCKLIYKDPPGNEPFDTNWPDKINEAEQNWEVWENFYHTDRTGFVARLYKPKGYKADCENDGNICGRTPLGNLRDKSRKMILIRKIILSHPDVSLSGKPENKKSHNIYGSFNWIHDSNTQILILNFT